MAVNLRTTHFRFGNDDGTESGHTFKAAEDTNIGLFEGDIFLLRFCAQELGGTAINNVDFQFQYKVNSGSWTNVTTTSSYVKAVAVSAFTNGQNCTKRLSGTGTFESTAAGCTEDGTSGGNQNDIQASGNSETECGLQIVAGSLNRGDTLSFQLISGDTTIVNNVTPIVTVLENLTLAVESGSFSLSGSSVRLIPSLQSVPYTLSGTDVALKYGRHLDATSGEYTLTGTDVEFIVGATTAYTMSAESGSFVLNNFQYITDEEGNYLTDEDGNYLITEDSYAEIHLIATRLIGASSGAFTLNGSEVLFETSHAYTYSISLDSGIFRLLVDFEFITDEDGNYLTDEDGNYLISEGATHDVDLLVDYKISLESGAYDLVGSDIISTGTGYSISLDSGSFEVVVNEQYLTDEDGNYLTDEDGNYLLWEGSYIDTKLIVTHLPGIGSGAFVLTGTDLSLLHHYVIGIDSGAFTLAGTDIAGLIYYKLSIDSGVYALTGTNITLTSGAVVNRILSLDPGAFTLDGYAVTLNYLGPDQTPGEPAGIYIMAAQYDDYKYNKVKSNVYVTNIVYDDYKYSVDGNKIYVNKLKATINEYMKEDVIHVHKVVKHKRIKVYNYVQ